MIENCLSTRNIQNSKSGNNKENGLGYCNFDKIIGGGFFKIAVFGQK